MSYARHRLAERRRGLRFDRSCSFISEGQFQAEMAALRRQEQALKARESLGHRGVHPRLRLRRIWKAYVGCTVATYLLLSLTPLGTWPDTFALGTLPWALAVALLMVVSLFVGYIPALLIASFTGTLSERNSQITVRRLP
jgi:hypothetical protein